LKNLKLEMQRYLKPNQLKMSKDEAITIFKMRSRVSEVKINYQEKYENLECDVMRKKSHKNIF
jgi:hypothetical protein